MADELIRRHKCVTCDNGRVTHFADGHVETRCHLGMGNEGTIPDLVTACTAYSFQYKFAPGRMTDQAWVLEQKKGQVIGFRQPKVYAAGKDDE